MVFSKKNLNFWKQLSLDSLMSTATETVSQFDVECERNSEISQNVQKLCFLQKKWVFRKKPWNFEKSLMVANLLYNAKELVRFLKTFNFWGLKVLKNTSVFREELNFIKWERQQTCRRINRNCNSPQKVQTSGFFSLKKWVFRIKILKL